MSTDTPRSLESILKTVGAIVTLGSLLLALAQFTVSQTIEAQKPFLVKKLAWCEEAINTAAMISVRPPGTMPGQELRFWELYYGLMGLVEKREIADAMIAFGEGLEKDAMLTPDSGLKESDPDPKLSLAERSLAELSLKIAHACRNELAADWSPIWGR